MLFGWKIFDATWYSYQLGPKYLKTSGVNKKGLQKPGVCYENLAPEKWFLAIKSWEIGGCVQNPEI